MSHSQWLYRNFTLYHKTIGYLRLREEKEVRRKAEMLLRTNQEDIPEDCQFLLEIEATPRTDTLTEKISYWVLAMKGALAEMKHERRREQQARRRGKPHKKEHWNIVNGVREAYSARGVYKGSQRTDDTLHNPASKRRKKEECD
jgi:DNA invertase Pin-like site-specific DNA recombinase